MKKRLNKTILFVALVFTATSLHAQSKEALKLSLSAMRVDRNQKKLLHFYYNETALGREQSDRTYAPFFSVASNVEAWFYPFLNITRTKKNTIGGGNGPTDSPIVTYLGTDKFYNSMDTTYRSVKGNYFARPVEYDQLNAWAVLLAWIDGPPVTKKKDKVYRDYNRWVFERTGSNGKERLFIDPKTNFPVKLDFDLLSSLWGQQHIEIVYSNWTFIDGSFFPVSAFRIEDGETMIYRTVGKSNLSDSVDLFRRIKQLPVCPVSDYKKDVLGSEQPVLVKINEQSYLTRNKFYTSVFTKIGDTVYLFDAPLNEARAKQDKKLIDSVFTKVQKYVLVVTDLAWPHIGGLRYWVSKGAVIVSHSASKKFIDKVIHQQWLLQPDDLQTHPKPMNFIAIDRNRKFARGELQIFPIDGIGSECALICFIPQYNLLWASDYIQDVRNPNAYAKEVIAAVDREGFKPVKFIAEHVGLTDWQKILELNK